MKKLILLFSLLVGSLAFGQEDVPFEVYGIWQSVDNEFLRIARGPDGQAIFQRINGREMKAMGTIKVIDGEMQITRGDKDDQYVLAYFIGNTTMVITKPRSSQAWLWNKVGN